MPDIHHETNEVLIVARFSERVDPGMPLEKLAEVIGIVAGSGCEGLDAKTGAALDHLAVLWIERRGGKVIDGR